jgi:hypothetical protein
MAGAGAVEEGLASAGASFSAANRNGTPLDAESILGDGLIGAGLGFGIGAGASLLGAAVRPFRGLGRAANRGDTVFDDLAGPRGLPQDAVAGTERELVYNPAPLGQAESTGPDRVLRPFRRLGGVAEEDLEQIVWAEQAGLDPTNAVAQRNRVQLAAQDMEDALGRVESLGQEFGNREVRLARARGLGTPAVDSVLPGGRTATQVAQEGLQAALSRLAPGTPTNALDRIRGALRGPGDDLDRLDAALSNTGESSRAILNEDSHQGAALRALVFGVTDEAGIRGAPGLLDAMAALGPGGEALSAAHRARLQALRRGYNPGMFGGFEASIEGASRRWRVHADTLGTTLQGAVGEAPRRARTEDVQRLFTGASEQAEAYARLFGSAPEEIAATRGRLGQSLRSLELADAGSRAREVFQRAQLAEKQAAGLWAAIGLGGATIGGQVGAAVSDESGAPLLGGTIGTALGLAFGAGTHPVGAFLVARRMGSSAARTQARITGGSAALRRSLQSGDFLATRPGPVTPVLASLRSEKHREENYEIIRERITSLASNPHALEEQLTLGPGRVSSQIDPVTGDAMAAGLVRAVTYLQANLPPLDQPTLFAALRDEDDAPSLTEMTSFLRRWEALEDPGGLLFRAADGTLEPEHVESVQAVFPELMTMLRSEGMDAVATSRGLPSFQQRVTIGTLLGIPTDRALAPSTLFTLQQTYSQTAGQAQTAGGGGRRGVTRHASSTASFSSDTQTSSQSMEEGLR